VANRKICVFTGTRAEYGLLRLTMRRIQNDPDLTLQTLVSGAHLSDRLGATWRRIEEDGFAIDAKVPMALDDDGALGLAQATGAAVADLADALGHLAPDILVVLGDRYEAFAAATAAMLLRLPIAHVHGGEITEGAMDDAMRHAITKMAHLHFTAAEAYRDRVIQMGEMPDRVFTVGAPGLEAIAETNLMTRDALAKDIGIALDKPFFVITYHPETLGTDPATGIGAVLSALDDFPQAPAIITHANADIGGQAINARINAYAAEHPGRVAAIPTLGMRRYFSAVAAAAVVIGNSSSGIIEAPFLGTPVVNIGSRQDGRLRAPTVIDCTTDAGTISDAIRRALSPDMQARAARKETPYGRGDSAERIVDALKSVDMATLAHKTFHDIRPRTGTAA